jgi:hypothetical protein
VTVGFADRVVDDQALHAMRKRLMDACNALELTVTEYRVLVAHGLCRVPLVELVRDDWLLPNPLPPELDRPMLSKTGPGPTLLEARRAWHGVFGKLASRPDVSAFADLLDHGGYSFRYRNLGSDVGMLAQTMHTAAGLPMDDTVRERRRFLTRLLDRVVVEECPLHGRSEVRSDCKRCAYCPCKIPFTTNHDRPGRPRLFCSNRCRQGAYRQRADARQMALSLPDVDDSLRS